MQDNIGKSAQNPMTPSQLNRLLSQVLKTTLSSFWLSGEITDCFQSSAGHSYFTLKDADASIRCVLFKQQQAFILKNGDHITVLGQVSMYAPRGSLQVTVMKAFAEGSGLLEQQFQQLKLKLENEGLFAAERKQKLPEFIEHIGIITSPNGAAIKDILQVIQAKNPLLEVTIYPSSVQGQHAVSEMISALKTADESNHQLLLLTRGGGSKEDLWCFNDEQLARTIVALKTPLLSAIGHERDISIADWVADESAITPTAAAERLIGRYQQQTHNLSNQYNYLNLLIQNNLRQNQQSIDVAAHQLQKQHPHNRILQQQNSLNRLQHLLATRMNGRRESAATQIQTLKVNLYAKRPDMRLNKSQLGQQQNRLQDLLQRHFDQRNQTFVNLIGQLQTLSPLNVLTRGYSYTTNMQGEVITTSKQVKINEAIETQLKSGKIRCKIVERFD